MPVGELDDFLREVPLIERIRASLSDDLQTFCQFRHLEDVSVVWSATIQQSVTGSVGRGPQSLLSVLPLAGNNFGNRKPSLGIFNRGCQNPAHRKLAVPLMQFVPA